MIPEEVAAVSAVVIALEQQRAEAAQVRQIFAIFIRTGSLAETLEEIDEQGFTTKAWTTRKSKQRAGSRFNRGAITRVLTNVSLNKPLDDNLFVRPL